MAKYCYIDVETTGLDHTKSAVWQLAGLIEVSGEKKEFFEYKIAPFEGAVLDDYALKMNKLTPEILSSFTEENIVYLAFKNMLSKYVDKYNPKDKFFFVGYNASFDEKFTREIFHRQKDKFFGSFFWYPPIDVMTIACLFLKNERARIPNFKLSTVCRYIGIDVEESKLHDASYDIELTMKLYKLFENTLSYAQEVHHV